MDPTLLKHIVETFRHGSKALANHDDVVALDLRLTDALSRWLVLRSRPGPSELAQAIAEAKAKARTAGLTDADIDVELEAYNAERRSNPAT